MQFFFFLVLTLTPLVVLFTEDKVYLYSTWAVLCKCIFSGDLNTFCLFSWEPFQFGCELCWFAVVQSVQNSEVMWGIIFTQPVFANRAKLTTHDKITALRCTVTQSNQTPQQQIAARQKQTLEASEDGPLSLHKHIFTRMGSVSAGGPTHSTIQTSRHLILFKVKALLNWNLELCNWRERARWSQCLFINLFFPTTQAFSKLSVIS